VGSGNSIIAEHDGFLKCCVVLDTCKVRSLYFVAENTIIGLLREMYYGDIV